MAVVKTNIALDMDNHRGATAQIVSSTSTEVIYTSGSLTSVYRGVGLTTLGDGIASGNVTSFSEYVGESLTLDVSGFSASGIGVAPQITTGNIGMLFRSILTGNDVITGSKFDDVLIGHGGNDIIYPDIGTNKILDTGGLDTVVLPGQYGQYALTKFIENYAQNFSYIFTRQDGASTNTVVGIERVQFENGTLALDVKGSAGQAFRLYKAAFDRTPDSDGLSFWIKALDQGASLRAVTQSFVDSAEFKRLYSSATSNSDFVQKLYQNVLHRTGENSGVTFWVAQLDNGSSKAQVLSYFSESAENLVGTSSLTSDGIWYV